MIPKALIFNNQGRALGHRRRRRRWARGMERGCLMRGMNQATCM